MFGSQLSSRQTEITCDLNDVCRQAALIYCSWNVVPPERKLQSLSYQQSTPTLDLWLSTLNASYPRYHKTTNSRASMKTGKNGDYSSTDVGPLVVCDKKTMFLSLLSVCDNHSKARECACRCDLWQVIRNGVWALGVFCILAWVYKQPAKISIHSVLLCNYHLLPARS